MEVSKERRYKPRSPSTEYLALVSASRAGIAHATMLKTDIASQNVRPLEQPLFDCRPERVSREAGEMGGEMGGEMVATGGLEEAS